jgi:hypothetical protein
MKKITGTFKTDFDDPRECLVLRLSQDAKEIATGGEVSNEIEIQLEDGAIPVGTEIFGNDELTPAGTYYDVTAKDPVGMHYVETHLKCLRISGKSPINLNDLIPMTEGELQELHKAASPYYNPPEEVHRVRVPAPRKPGSPANHFGFFGVTITYPAGTKAIPVPAIAEEKLFGVCAFTLPFRAVVGCASIIFDSAAQGSDNKLIVGLYDASGKRVCVTTIDVCSGMATGEFDPPMPLPAGDYHLAWAVARHSASLQIRTIDVDREKMSLVNAGGGATVFGFGKIRSGDSLPEKLELDGVPRAPIAPPLVYFKG